MNTRLRPTPLRLLTIIGSVCVVAQGALLMLWITKSSVNSRVYDRAGGLGAIALAGTLLCGIALLRYSKTRARVLIALALLLFLLGALFPEL
jgi:hypothetical protein